MGTEGSSYSYITSISDIIADENDEVIVLPSEFEENVITHLGYYQDYEEAHEVWCDYHHPAKGSDFKEAEYKRGYSRFNIPKNIKKVVVPSTIIDIGSNCFDKCTGLTLEFSEDSKYFIKDNCVYNKPYPNLILIKLK